MSLLKVNEVQNYNGSSLTLTASTVSTSAQLNTGGNVSVTGSINVSDDSTTRSNLGLGTMATQAANSVAITGGNISNATLASSVTFPANTIQRTSFAENTSQVSLTAAGPSTIVTGTIQTDASYASDFIIALATINGQIYGNNSTTSPSGKYDIYDSTGTAVKQEYAINAEFSANTRYVTGGHSISARFTPASQNASYTVLVRIKDVTGFLNSFDCQLYLFYVKG